jgi:hypothetical protein
MCPFAFCLRSDGMPYAGEDLNRYAVTWLIEMFPPAPPPEPGVWMQVPRRFRPAGIAQAEFKLIRLPRVDRAELPAAAHDTGARAALPTLRRARLAAGVRDASAAQTQRSVKCPR